MKNKYESVIIISGKLTDEEYKKAFEEITERIKNIIDIDKIDEIGKKRLAYEIQKNKDGFYVVFYFEAQGQDILELERIYRITDEIIKFMTIKVDD